ncbi:hypothetical protein GCM10010531_39390 [Blastococcus jejuensis]|uniref:Secreted protein n=1 Tax=Blastococcus jejuensis TaxID=351224 RepID=A0ABP6PKW3_9ACTN
MNRLRSWLLPVATLVAGLLIGWLVAVALQDPTASDEYRAVQIRAEDAEARAGEYQRARDVYAQRAGDLAEREAEIAAREQAVTAEEQRIAVSTIGVGIWTVGVDVEPGTYRTDEPVAARCYWGIYRSGTNGSDIEANDNVEGGFPTVTLSEGQDFENRGCPDFVKQ